MKQFTNKSHKIPVIAGASLALGLSLVALVVLLEQPNGADAQISLFADKLPSFGEFKRLYGKIYASSQEDARRERIFNKTLSKIDHHNRLFNDNKATYALYPCEYSDMDEQEVATFLKGIVLPDDVLDPEEFNKTLSAGSRLRRQASEGKEVLPETVDYRTSGCLSLPKDQKFCGSCWSQAVVSAIETMKCMKSGRLETMSAQNLIDCASRKHGYKLDGCAGGMFPDAIQYVINNGGIDDEECYPYGANDREACRYSAKCKAGTVATWRRIPPTEEALKSALAKHGPVLAAIHSNDDFFSYNSGVYDDPKCTNERAKINHGVVVVGYGSENGKDFWIVRNSWGYTWGEKGYMKLIRGKPNNCCINCYIYVIDV